MNGIALAIQRVVMWIPYFNIFNWFAYFYNSVRLGWSMGVILKGFGIAAMYMLPVIVLQFLLLQFLPGITHVTDWIIMYLIPLAMSHGLIRCQDSLDELL